MNEPGAPDAPHGVGTATPEPLAAEPRVRLPVAVLVVAAALVVGLLVIGGAVWISTPRLSTGPEADPPPPGTAAATRVTLDPATRQVSVGEAKMTLPAAPYVCEGQEEAKPPLFTSLVTCDTVIHEDYNGQGDDWYATVGFGVVSADYATPDDPAGTSRQVFDALRQAFYTDVEVKVTGLNRQRVSLARPTASLYGNLNFEVDGLDSRYDRLLVASMQLGNGDFAVLFTGRPDDTPKATLKTLDAALTTFGAS